MVAGGDGQESSVRAMPEANGRRCEQLRERHDFPSIPQHQQGQEAGDGGGAREPDPDAGALRNNGDLLRAHAAPRPR